MGDHTTRLDAGFYRRDVLDVAPDLLGKVLCHAVGGDIRRGRITEVEAYRGEEDTACHARAGKTSRTAVMYEAGGLTYVYLCYGMHHLLNIVTGMVGQPQAVLIRGLAEVTGPGRLTIYLGITTADNATDLVASPSIWIEDAGCTPRQVVASPRIGIAYASDEDRERLWRFTAQALDGGPSAY